MKNYIELFHIIIHTLVLFKLWDTPDNFTFKALYFTSDCAVVLYHCFYCRMINNIHRYMVFLHMWIHYEAIMFVFWGVDSEIFNYNRVFDLAMGKSAFSGSVTDYLYTLGTIQDICTHGLNILSSSLKIH